LRRLRAAPGAEFLRVFSSGVAALAILAAPLGACSTVGLGFDKFDGRWVANVPPAGNCCPSRVVMDVEGHKFQGTVEDCDGVTALEGHVDDNGQGTLHMKGQQAPVKFSGVNFSTVVPLDRCRRTVMGNLGG
jgi:hypothetical protein